MGKWSEVFQRTAAIIDGQNQKRLDWYEAKQRHARGLGKDPGPDPGFISGKEAHALALQQWEADQAQRALPGVTP